MRLLYLIRHATPVIQPATDARDWTLSEHGILQARVLGEIAAMWALRAVYSSSEPKAQATALLIGDATGQFVRVVDGFEELRFDAWIGNADEFSEAVRAILDHPEVSVRGAEPAEAAADRFAAGVAIVEQGPFPAAIVSHGRVLSAYLARLLGLAEPFDLWRSIPMPGYACIDLDIPRPHLLAPFRGIEDA